MEGFPPANKQEWYYGFIWFADREVDCEDPCVDLRLSRSFISADRLRLCRQIETAVVA